MAATDAPLVWECAESIGSVDGLGGNVHYFDESAQMLYLNSGIATKTAKVTEGHWCDATFGDEIIVDDTAYTLLSVDHPYNGVLYMVATDGTSLVCLRYVYAGEFGDIIESGTWKGTTDSQIAQLSLTIMNVKAATFAAAGTLFNPGAKMTLSIRSGDSDPYKLGVARIDSVKYKESAATIPVSGRNLTGFSLKDQTFDTTTSITGYGHEVAAAILEMAGITDYHIEESTKSATHKFKPEQTLLSGLQQLCDYFIGWQMIELADGSFVIGYPDFVRTYQANSYYEFNIGSEVWQRETTKAADAAYTHVYVTGKDEDDNDLTPVYLAVNNYDYWELGSHKTCHITAPDGLTQSELSDYATQCALDLQYVGIGEQFGSPLRPQLLPGDVAAIYETGDEETIALGAITEITQHFGKKGFYTDFTVDSGGEVTDGEDYAIVRNAALSGYNRRPKMADFIRSISGEKIWRR